MLVLTARTGAGHLSVARAVAAEVCALAGGRLHHTVADAFQLATGPSPVETVVRSGYGAAIVHVPEVWGAIYHATRPRVVYGALVAGLGHAAARRMEALLRREQPRLIVSTHPLALWLAGTALRRWAAAGGPRLPLWAMVTDLVSIHPAWVGMEVERYLVGCAEGAGALRRLGVPGGAIAVTGLPVDPLFEALGGAAACGPQLRSALIVGGGEGAGRLVGVTTCIAAAHPWLDLTVVCGRNKRAYTHLRATLGGRPHTRIYGYVDEMPRLMAEASVVITKAGSVTIAEAAAAGRPLILMEVLPGQEAGNAALVARHGAGIVARREGSVARVLGELAAHPARLAALAEGCRRLGYPDAAHVVARDVLRRCLDGAF